VRACANSLLTERKKERKKKERKNERKLARERIGIH
jgi:hypothetical protein